MICFALYLVRGEFWHLPVEESHEVFAVNRFIAILLNQSEILASGHNAHALPQSGNALVIFHHRGLCASYIGALKLCGLFLNKTFFNEIEKLVINFFFGVGMWFMDDVHAKQKGHPN